MENLNVDKRHKKIKKNRIMPIEIKMIKKCTTKKQFIETLKTLNNQWKKLIKFYLTDCFIFDLYTRKIENKLKLLENREIFYAIIENPDMLNIDCHFDNNMVKNYCSGLGNYLKKYHKKMREIIIDYEEQIFLR